VRARFRSRIARSCLAALAALCALGSAAAFADDHPPAADQLVTAKKAPAVEKPRRYELAGFPIIGGNSDIGFQFGAAGTLTRFYDQAFPYEWNLDLLLSASLKDDAGRLALAQQSHVLRLDAPDVFGGRARFDTRGSFQRTINSGYYGVGNASLAVTNPDPHHYWYIQEEGRVREILRVHTGWSGIDFAVGVNLRYESPSTYGTSAAGGPTKLVADAIGPGASVIGTRPAFLAGGTVGMMYDTRESEFVTRTGVFYQLGIGATVGTEERVAYGEASAVLAHYAPVGGPFVFASRFVFSFQFGRVPFYDLAQGGNFEPQYLLGSENGVRGVPQGRYIGRVKALSNLEIRSTPFPHFALLGQRLRIGTTTFFDVGRTWSDYSTISPADGNSLNLKYGVGGGLFLQWGEAAIFRVEVAYSPDAVAENPSLPLGIYVSDGLMF
jgi:hypothetical protein